jgi:hypothetical protein
MADPLTHRSITGAFDSGSGVRVLDVLKELRELADKNQGPHLAPPGRESWARLDHVTDDLVVLFLDLLRHYPRFDPPLTHEQIREESLEVNLRYGSHRGGFNHALLIATSPIPAFEADEVLLLLRTRGISGAQETHAAQWLVSYLLDDLKTRRAAISALKWMDEREDLCPVFEYVKPQLTPTELAEIV